MEDTKCLGDLKKGTLLFGLEKSKSERFSEEGGTLGLK